MWQNHLVRRLALIGLVLLLGALYLFGAVRQLEYVNTDMGDHDQSAYMKFVKQVAESGFTYTGDRNRMPIYPALQALFYRPGASDEALFRQGKYVNLILSLLLLTGLALIFRHFFTPLHTLNLTLITGFTVFIFRAGWFQAELLFYFLNFCLFLLFWRLLQRPSPWLALLAGLTAALTHLTKASVLPGLVIFAACAAVQAAWLFLRRRSPAAPRRRPIRRPCRHWRIRHPPSAVPQSAIRNPAAPSLPGFPSQSSCSSWAFSCSPCLLISTRASASSASTSTTSTRPSTSGMTPGVRPSRVREPTVTVRAGPICLPTRSPA